MTNHFHLLLQCRVAGLSEAMHSLEARYARWFNDRYERDGPIFRGRFTSVLVDSDEQLLTVWRYIHRNPLALVPRDALVAYRWSSFGPYLQRRPGADWLVADDVTAAFGGDVDRMRAFVETDLPSDLLHPDRHRVAPSVTRRPDRRHHVRGRWCRPSHDPHQEPGSRQRCPNAGDLAELRTAGRADASIWPLATA